MRSAEVLVEAFGRLPDLVHRAVDGLSADQLAHRLDPEANTVAWLVWHLARVQDAQVAEVASIEPRWSAAGWRDRFGLPLGPDDTGYGHDAAQVGVVKAPAELLVGYAEDVCRATCAWVATLSDGDLDQVVDQRWDPPVTLGVRLVSVVADDLEHVGQAAILRGIIERGG